MGFGAPFPMLFKNEGFVLGFFHIYYCYFLRTNNFHVQIFVYPSYLIYCSFLYMYYLAVSEIKVFIFTQSLVLFS